MKTTIEAAGATVDCTGDTVYCDHRPTRDRILAEHTLRLDLSFTYFDSFDSQHALLQISGLTAPLALRLRKIDKKQNSFVFPNPVLLEVDSRLVSIEDTTAKQVQWTLDDEECSCDGFGFDRHNRSIDEFQFDIIVRTTDPLVQTSPLVLEDGVDPSLALDAETCDSLFRAPLTRDSTVAWDETPRISQALTVSHGRVFVPKRP